MSQSHLTTKKNNGRIELYGNKVCIRSKSVSFVFLIAAVFIIGCEPEPSSTHASEREPGHYYVIAPVLNSRIAPRNGQVVNQIKWGQKVTVYKFEKGWALITKPGRQHRWVSAKYLSRNKPKSGKQSAETVKQAQERSHKADRGQVVDQTGPFTVAFENYLKNGSGGANLHVNNSSSTEYSVCTIELGDGGQGNRWYLPNSTVIDANGRRSYPTFLFRDRQGISPPTPDSVSRIVIRCSNPVVSQQFHAPIGRWRREAAKGKAGVTASKPGTNGGHMSEKEMRNRMASWVTKGQSAVKARLRDPDSAKWGQLSFAWGVDGVGVVCGQVNAKNGLGGYTGMQYFISAGTANLTFLQREVENFTNLWEVMCGKKNNQAAVRMWGPAADIAPIRFR